MDFYPVTLEGKGMWVGIILQDRMLKKVVLGKDKKDLLSKLKLSGDFTAPSSNFALNLKKRFGEDTPFARNIKKDFANYFCGKKVDFSSYPLQMDLSEKARKILFEVRKIPYGQLRTYKWVAQRIGSKGCRAVGRILSINPFPIIIPCHRVICSDGRLGGFSAGVELKKKLLRLEGVVI